MDSSSTIVLITGANSGVGFACSQVIVSASPKYHVIMASRNQINGERAAAEVQAVHDIKGSVSTVELDVTDPGSIHAAAKQVEERFGRIDVLVNNAGIKSTAPDTKTEFQETFAVNVIGPALVTEAFTPLLLKSQKPYSVYVSSGLGSLTMASNASRWDYGVDATVYRTSKAALNMWVVQEFKNLGKKGVKPFAMCPGLVISNLRGKDEASRSAGGAAKDPQVSGETLLGIIEGRQDANVGKSVSSEGSIYPWELMCVITKNSKICKIASLRLWDEAGHTGTEVPWNRLVNPEALNRGLIQGTASVKQPYTKCRVSAKLKINFGKSLAILFVYAMARKDR